MDLGGGYPAVAHLQSLWAFGVEVAVVDKMRQEDQSRTVEPESQGNDLASAGADTSEAEILMPTPWAYVPYIRRVKDARGMTVAFGVGEADGALIVSACNAFDEMLASLKECREALAACFRTVDDIDALADELRRVGVADGFGVRAQRAIAKAEGK